MRRQKNFLITLVLVIFFWLTFFLQVYFVKPIEVKDILISNSYLLFFLNLFLALFFTLAVIFTSSLRGLLFSLSIIIFLVLRIFGLGSWLNLILITAITIALNRSLNK